MSNVQMSTGQEVNRKRHRCVLLSVCGWTEIKVEDRVVRDIETNFIVVF